MWTAFAICLLAAPALYAQTVTHTNGTSGEPCPVKKCLAGKAVCNADNQCECLPPFQLDPYNGNFACYRSNQVFGEVKNDPTVRNFNDETAQFPYPCRYLLTSTQTNLRINKQDQGSCRCVLHGFNQKFRGKIAFFGFDFACHIVNTLLAETLDFSTRIYGEAQNGNYQYTEHSTNNFLPDGPWSTAPLNLAGAGITVQTTYDTVNNQARISILQCGFVITFVAYDTVDRRQQEQVPGCSFGVNCGLNPFFFDHNETIATAPVKFGGTTYADLAVPPLTVPSALLIRAFESNTVQNQPGASPYCSTLGNHLQQCANQQDEAVAANRCFFMLDEPLLMRCLDSNLDATPVLRLAQLCVDFSCGNNGVTCQQFVQAAIATNCGSKFNVPQWNNIISGNICSQ